MDKTSFHRYCINTNPARGEIEVLSCVRCREQGGGNPAYNIGEAYVIHYLSEGAGWFDNGRHRFRLDAGDGFVVFPDTMYKFAAQPGGAWSYCAVSLKGDGVEGKMQEVGLSPGQPVVRLSNPRRLPILFRQIERCMSGKRTPGYDLMLGGYIRLFLVQFVFNKQVSPTELPSVTYGGARAILKAVEWIVQHYPEPVIITDLADRMGIRKERFSNLFKRHIGMSPKEFLIHLRMDKARNLMYSDLTVKQVAQQVGYEDALYFSRLFKKTYTVSPDEFRKQIPLCEGIVRWQFDR